VTIKNSLNDYLSKNASLGTICLSLKRLTREGYLRTDIGMSVSKKGGRAKKYYRLILKSSKVMAELTVPL
jgi:DNA-binding PadR family transcriptional regulator